MKKLMTISALLCALLLLSFSLTGCFLEDILSGDKTEAPSHADDDSDSDSDDDNLIGTDCVCRFLDGDELLQESTLKYGTVLNNVSFTKEGNASVSYVFLGWDANGDGVPEEFPYTIKGDTEFQAVCDEIHSSYHYDIYVSGQLVKSADVPYGTPIEYPNVESTIINDEVNIFRGWKYDGIFDGNTYSNVTKNVRIDAYFAENQILRMYYDGLLYAKYLESGNTIGFLNDWNITVGSEYTIRWYVDDAYKSKFTGTTMPVGNLTIYGRKELTVAPPETGTDVSTKEALLAEFNVMEINRIKKGEFNLKFACDDVNSIVSYLIKNAYKMHNYQLSATLSGSKLKLTVSYSDMATKKTSGAVYTQLTALNIGAYPNTRSSSFNNFAVEKIAKAFTVTNSDALYYALENGYRPVIESGNTKLAQLYDSMKNALRIAVSDSMTDFEKARAIYDYLIMNVVYDDKLLKLVESKASGLEAYNGFYLEGVFNDHLAVCDGISKAYSALCSMEGIQCVRITGTVNTGGNHAWNKVKIDGKWYVVDATSGGSIVDDNEAQTYAYFLITDARYKDHAVEDGVFFPGLNCTAVYDIYSYLTLGGISLKVTSAEQGAELISYLATNADNGVYTLDFEAAFGSGDAGETVNAIIEAYEGACSISYISNFKSITLIYDSMAKNN